MTTDSRWQQRFYNFQKAWRKLQQAIELTQKSPGSLSAEEQAIFGTIISEGLIQRFEYTHELAWNVMKDYAAYQGNFEIRGSRDATREAFKMGLIESADAWMDMVQSRNLTTHTYNEEVAEDIQNSITGNYQFRFAEFEKKMSGLMPGD